jgi:hypothetical protein
MAINNMYTVRAATRGNPDFGQYAPISDPANIEAPTLDQLRAKVRGYMEYYQVGGGNWNTPPVYRDGKKVGNMSYNLRIWRGETAVDEPTNHDVIDWDEGKAMDEIYRRICKKQTVIKLKGDDPFSYHTYKRPYTTELAGQIRRAVPDLAEIVNERFLQR